MLEATAYDDRSFAKNAVNWALRNIGKRNGALRQTVMEAALRSQHRGLQSARWIAADALRELQSPAVCRQLVNI